MRSKRALLNTLSGFLYQLVAIVCGLIVPRLVLSHFGSSYNGITSSMTQFLSSIALLKAGIGGVTRAALYKPLADHDTEQISSVVKTTEHFMRKIVAVFSVLVVFFACTYPMLIGDEFSWAFTASLVLILSISTFAQYFFGLTYQMLLQAGQQQCVIYIIQIITTLLNTIIAAILILAGCSIHVVKLGSAVIFALNPIAINFYAKKKYKINEKAPLNNKLISQRWDAFAQEIAFFVHNNTDIIVLTVFTNLYEVSVYTVYNYVVKELRSLVEMMVTGFNAAFGDMIAKKEYDLLERNLRIYELIVFSLAGIVYTVAGVMIVPYALLYTHGVSDVDYARPFFAFLIIFAGAFSCFRMPYKTIVDAAGHFKQNRNGALVEAGLNITISVLSVVRFGLVGVAFGTVVATIFRSVQYSNYLSKNIIHRKLWRFTGHIGVFIVGYTIIYLVSSKFILPIFANNVQTWIMCAVIVTLLAVAVTTISNLIFYREEFVDLIQKLLKAMRKR